MASGSPAADEDRCASLAAMTCPRGALLAVLLVPALPAVAAAGDERPWFVDVAAATGLAFLHDPAIGGEMFMPESMGAGCALFDYDGDGDLDAYLIDGARRGGPAGPPLRNRLFRRDADGRFVDVTGESGLGDAGYGMGVAVGDVDGDGDPDVYVTNYGPNALYRNDGDGTFTDVTRAAGIDNPAWGTSAVFFDADGDGDLDLYVANYVAYDPAVSCPDAAGRPDYCGPAGFAGVADRLYRNDGAGTFTDVSRAAGIGGVAGKGLGVVSADFDGDGRADLYLANDGEANRLWINRGDGTFEDRALALGAALNELGQAEAGMGIALGDADGDGALDLFVSHLRGESNTLYRSAGALGFVDSTSAAGLAGPSLPWTGFGTGFFDLDLDGDLDLAVVDGRVTRGPLTTTARPAGYWDPYAEPALLFANDGRGRFREVGALAGTDFTAPRNGRGLALGDVDDDGDVDLLVTADGGPARLLDNQAPRAGHWLEVRVVDVASGSDLAGAVVTLGVAVGPAVDPRRQVRVVAPGGSYLSSGDPRAHFGLGAATEVEELRVRTPAGAEVVYRHLPVDRELVVPVAGAPTRTVHPSP